MNNSLTATPGRKFGAPLAALFLLLMGAQFLLLSVGTRQVMLWIVGAALGVTLYHAAFGFTSAWRVFIRERRGAGLRA
ncbi:YeeE/YedE, partial [Pseudomonas amygdali pv. lachrymans]